MFELVNLDFELDLIFGDFMWFYRGYPLKTLHIIWNPQQFVWFAVTLVTIFTFQILCNLTPLCKDTPIDRIFFKDFRDFEFFKILSHLRFYYNVVPKICEIRIIMCPIWAIYLPNFQRKKYKSKAWPKNHCRLESSWIISNQMFNR